MGLLADVTRKLETEVVRTGTIIERLRGFLSQGDLVASRFDLAATLRRVVANLSEDARSRAVGIEVRASCGRPTRRRGAHQKSKASS